MECTPPMCQICQGFLQDFLLLGISKELPLANQVRMKSMRKILPELSEWMYRFYRRLPKEKFEKALLNASRIARRGRPLHEYEYLIHTATFNFLKFQYEWVASEVSYLETLLLESGFVRTKNTTGFHSNAYNYISYVTPRVIITLDDLHDDHVHPKGIQTDLGKLFQRRPQNDNSTCADRDLSYQKEILDDTDDLYS